MTTPSLPDLRIRPALSYAYESENGRMLWSKHCLQLPKACRLFTLWAGENTLWFCARDTDEPRPRPGQPSPPPDPNRTIVQGYTFALPE